MSEYPWEELFEIARKAILHYFRNKDFLTFEDSSPKTATFVTLEKRGNLRGCIGSIIPIRPLKQDVAVNAVNAAFFDPRFPPLSTSELQDIWIEISILSPLYRFEGENEEWLSFLREKKPGVYITSHQGSATFLPDVWKEVEDEKNFMELLSLKAGLSKDAWKEMKKYYYFTDAKKEPFLSRENSKNKK